ncbi:MAG: DUF1007 family protein [Pseudomonadota bacterium]
MLRLVLSLLLMMGLGGVAKAHPHVFVDARTKFHFGTDGQLEAVRIFWRYDEFTTLVLFEALNLDQDGDGRLNDADRTAIITGETNWDPDYKGDVYLEVAGQDYPLGRPEAPAARLVADRIEVSFDLPLSHPVRIGTDPAFLRLYDPIFYYAYTILPTEEGFALPPGCVAEIIPFDPDAVDRALQEKLAALGRDEVPEQDNVGRLFADEVSLACG